jgi:hypothetical protein
MLSNELWTFRVLPLIQTQSLHRSFEIPTTHMPRGYRVTCSHIPSSPPTPFVCCEPSLVQHRYTHMGTYRLPVQHVGPTSVVATIAAVLATSPRDHWHQHLSGSDVARSTRGHGSVLPNLLKTSECIILALPRNLRSSIIHTCEQLHTTPDVCRGSRRDVTTSAGWPAVFRTSLGFNYRGDQREQLSIYFTRASWQPTCSKHDPCFYANVLKPLNRDGGPIWCGPYFWHPYKKRE